MFCLKLNCSLHHRSCSLSCRTHHRKFHRLPRNLSNLRYKIFRNLLHRSRILLHCRSNHRRYLQCMKTDSLYKAYQLYSKFRKIGDSSHSIRSRNHKYNLRCQSYNLKNCNANRSVRHFVSLKCNFQGKLLQHQTKAKSLLESLNIWIALKFIFKCLHPTELVSHFLSSDVKHIFVAETVCSQNVRTFVRPRSTLHSDLVVL